jgi:NitT/TauT family transport system ATP-binding protein
MKSDSIAKISVSNLSHQFKIGSDSKPLVALDNINIEINKSKFISIVGESGCGKSTLLRIMAGLIIPSTGLVKYENKKVTGIDPNLGFVFQQDSVFPWLTVAQNIEYGLKARGIPRAERKDLVEHWCHLVGLIKFQSAYPKQLSGGMRKRVDLARVFVNSPSVLLMDEPFGALDVQTKHDMQEVVLDLWSQTKSTIIFVTHDLEEAVFLSNKVLVMSSRPGQISSLVDITLDYPRTEGSRMSDSFHTSKQSLWLAMQTARLNSGK